MRQSNTLHYVRKYFDAKCSSSEQVGDLVFIYDGMIDGALVVRKCDPTDRAKMPAFGMIIEKTGTLDCVVQRHGMVFDLYSGLVPNDFYFVDLLGEVGDYPRPGYKQNVGQAIADNVFFLNIEIGMTKLLAA